MKCPILYKPASPHRLQHQRPQADAVKRYIANQAKHHRRVDFKKEFVTLLKRHEIEFEERYLWD